MNTLNRSFGVERLEARRLLSFAAPVNYAVGPSPQAVVTGDFNNDGKLDLAVANHDGGTVSVLPGDGQGGFGAARQSAVGTGPLSLTVGDFNNDGKLDLAVIRGTAGTYWNNSMCVVLGNGDGTFRAPTVLGSTWIAVGAAAGDFNADGKIDLVVGQDDTEGAGYIEVLLGNGQGGFTAAGGESSAHGLSAPSLAVGDLNGDGKLDAVMVCGPEGSGGFAFLGNGNGTFGPYGLDWPQFDTGEDPRAVKIGDFTGDGIPDLISAGQAVDVLRGHGDGSFDAPISQTANGAMHTGVAVADFTGDGKLDAVVSDADTGTVSLMLQNADGTLRFVGAFTVGSAPSAVAVGDFNGDGRPDVAATNAGSNNVSILINDGNWVTKTYGGPASGGNWSTPGNWSPSGAPISSDWVNIAGKSVNLNSSATVAGLTLTGGAVLNVGAAGNRVFRTSALAITGSKLNLNDNDLIVEQGSFTAIRALVLQGFGPGATTGITSSTSNGSQILALFDNALVGAPAWNGQPIGPNAIVGKYTYFGDMNLDGQVSGDDYTVIDANLGTAPLAGFAWLKGDANLDGIISGDDYTVIDANLGKGVGSPLIPSDSTRRREIETL